MSKTLIFVSFLFVLLSTLLTSCNNDDSNDIATDPDLANAQLDDFPLSEVDYLDIHIVHPELQNGVEKRRGEITITVPEVAGTNMTFSLKEFSLDQQKYSIDPVVGSVQDFSEGPVIYTVASTLVENSQVHYEVTVELKAEPINENYKILGLKFEQSKNPALTSTIEAFKVVEYSSFSQNAIYVFVPEGTDFSELTPTILSDAAAVYYNNGGETKPYPAPGTPINFQYPNRFTIYAENSNGVKSKIYNVIVDVKNPVRFETASIVTPNVKIGDGGTELLPAVATWTNIGNHPVSTLTTSEYKNKTFPVEGMSSDVNIIKATLFNPVGGTPGVLPGEKGNVNVSVSRIMVKGTYKTTASFQPTFNFNLHVISSFPPDDLVEDIFEPVEMEIQTTLEE